MSTDKGKIKLNLAGYAGIYLAAYPLIYTLFARQRDASEYASVDFSAFASILYTFIAFIFIVNEFLKKDADFLKIVFCSNLRWFFWFSIWGLCTIFWTVNIPLTGYRAFECITLFLLIIMVISKLIRQHGVDIAIQWVLAWLVFGELLIKYLKMVSWAGFANPFVLHIGQMSITVFFYLAVFHCKKNIFKVIAGIFSFLSSSTTAYIGMALGSMGLWIGKGKQRFFAFAICLVAVFGILTLGVHDFFKDTVFSQRTEIGLEYSSGRDQIWQMAWDWGNQRPIGGWGFAAAEPYLIHSVSMNGVINFHSSVCSAFVGTGYIGLVLLLIYIFSFIPILLHKDLLGKYRGALIGCYCVALCHCIANPGIGSRVYGSWKSVTILFVLISVIAYFNQKNNLRQEK